MLSALGIIRRAKQDFLQDALERDGTATKCFWEKVNYLLPKNDNSSTIRLIETEQNAVIEDSDLPDYINNFFTGIGPKLASKFKEKWVPDLPAYHGEEIGQIWVDL